MALITEPFVDGSPASTMLSQFSGVLGFSSDSKRFLLAREYCPRLSPLIYIQRLLFLELALPNRPYSALGIPSRPVSDQLKRLNEVREQYMVIGAQSCFAELISLRDAGRTISRTEPPAFILRWSDDGNTVYFGPERSLTINDFRQLSDYFISQAEKLTKKLMLGIVLDIDLASMRDNIINSDCGYSFVKHSYNNLELPYQKLLVQACTSGSAGLSRDGKWSWSSITAYLKDTEKLEEMLAGGLHTSCGQVPRLRELLSLELENGPMTKGSISLWNGYVIYTIRHHKAKRQTNKEFHVARFLPAQLGVAFCKYMACIRRLADMLRRERHAHAHRSHPPRSCNLLFHSSNLAWKPSRITSILKRATKELWNYPVNAQLYRQIAIGITERHVREVYKPFNRYDDVSAHADLNVAFSWQSGHRPLQRGITYGLDGAFPHQLQPALLRAYEWASTRWHEFIKQPSKVLPPRERLDAEPFKRKYKRKIMPYVAEEDGPFDSNPEKKRRRRQASGEQIWPQSVTKHYAAQQIQDERAALEVERMDQVTQQAGGRLRLENIACILHEHNVLICLICRAAVRPGKAITPHFRKAHEMKGEPLRRVLSFCKDWSFNDPVSVALPRDGTRLIPELPTLFGYSCKECGFKTTSRKNMICHFSKSQHKIPKSEEARWTTDLLQSFCGGRWARYWIVSS